MKWIYLSFLLVVMACSSQKFAVLKPLDADVSIDEFNQATCLSSEGQVQLAYFSEEKPKVSYESFFDKNYKNWGLAISIPFSGEEDLHLNWRKSFLVEGSIGTKLKSTSFKRTLRRYQITRSEIMRALYYWADTIDVISRAKDPKDKINREKLASRVELVNNTYVVQREVSKNLKFRWVFKNRRKAVFEEQIVEFISPYSGKSIRFTFYVRECLK